MNAPSASSTEWARWPPRPGPAGRDLNPWLAVLLVPLVPIVFYEGELRWMISHRITGWVHDPTIEAFVRSLRLDLVELALILAGIAWLGWWAAVGIRRADVRIPYRWSVVPLGVVGALTLAACASPEVAQKGVGVFGFAVTAIFAEALIEELLFRGIGLHALSRAWGGVAGVLVSSTLFILIHIPGRLEEFSQDPVIMPLKYFAAAVVLCRIRVATGSIWWPTAYHTLWNFLVFARVWGAFGTGSVLSALTLTEFFVGVGLALLLPLQEDLASGRAPYLLGREAIAHQLVEPKVGRRWSAVIRGRVVGGIRQPTPEQQPEVDQRQH